MVALPDDDRWSIRILTDTDKPRVLRFLERDPLMNVYLISRILDEGMSLQTQTIEIEQRRRTICVATLSSNVVAAVDPEAPADSRAMALTLLSDRVVRSSIAPRAIICEATVVEELWRNLQPRLDPPTVVRLNQPVYALSENASLPRELHRVRYGRIDDLDQLVPACAAMHREEVGIDPLERDAIGYRQRIRELVLRRRSLLMREGGKIAFKTEFSAVTPAAVQLMGVWTVPELRRRGFAQLGLAEICGHLLAQQKVVTLFVNDFNTGAIRLYESLGFRRIGANRALIW
jgi:uncharacterized protein